MSLFDLAQLRSPPSPERFRSAAAREEVVLTEREAAVGDSGSTAENYQVELHRLLEKSKGTPYEATLRKFVEAKAATPNAGSGWQQQQHEHYDGPPQQWSPVRGSSSSSGIRSPRGGSAPNAAIAMDVHMHGETQPQPNLVFSPTRSKARADVTAILLAREHRAKQESLSIEQDNVHKTRRNFTKAEEWIDRISTPKKNQTRAHEVQHRLKTRVMRNSTNHIGRQRQNPAKEDAGAAFSPFGAVNLSTKTGGVAATDNDVIFKSATNDKRKNVFFAGSHLALKTKKISERGMQEWIEENQRWRASLDEKKQMLAQKHHGHSFTPRVAVDSESNQLLVDAALKRESKQLRHALREVHAVQGGHRAANIAIAVPDDVDEETEALPIAPIQETRTVGSGSTSGGKPPMPPMTSSDYSTSRTPANHVPFGGSPARVTLIEPTSPERRSSSALKLFGHVDDVVTEEGLVLPPPPADAPPDMTDTNTAAASAVSSPGIVDLDFSKTDRSVEQRFAREELEYQLQRRQQQHQESPRGRSRERSNAPESNLLAHHHHHSGSPKTTSRGASPNVFDRMCIRIAAHTIQARKPWEPVIGSDNEAQCTFAPVINSISTKMIERRNTRELTRHENVSTRARSASPSTDKFSTSRRRGSFFGLYEPSPTVSPGYGRNGSDEYKYQANTGAGAMSPNIRKAKQLLAAQEQGQEKNASKNESNRQCGASLGKPPTAPVIGVKAKARKRIPHIGRMRSSSESPARPIFGIRSVNFNYILPTDTIGQGTKWAAKQEMHKQREIERRRSPTPENRYNSPVHNEIVKEHQKAERRRSHWRNAADFMKEANDGQSISVTERLNRFYAAREQEKTHQSSFERTRRGSVITPKSDPLRFGSAEAKSPAPFERIKFSHEHQYHKPALRFSEAQGEEKDIDSVLEDIEIKRRRESKIWNDHIFERSGQKDKDFMERTKESVEEFNVRRGVSDLLILKGVAPSPCTYVVPTSTVERFSASNYRKNLVMKNDNATEGLGNAENGRAGYTFAKKQRQFAQFGHVKIQGLAHKLLEKVLDFTESTEIAAEHRASPASFVPFKETADEPRSVSPKASRRQSVARFDRWGNMM